ncbi:hypothetical protein [Holophaga foetida]|nr:hypothetical protein [Holophaga foetida]
MGSLDRQWLSVGRRILGDGVHAMEALDELLTYFLCCLAILTLAHGMANR